MNTNRHKHSKIITDRLLSQYESLKDQWIASGCSYFIIDDLLDPELVHEIYSRFPHPSSMMVRKSLREYKYVAAQMDRFDPMLEEIVFAFQELNVLHEIEKIVCKTLFPDDRLYAGGISLMSHNHFLNPHLDNSHDADRKLYRALNLLFYVTPNWSTDSGGHLELWLGGVKKSPQLIESRFNRLVVMSTNESSWHSVSAVKSDRRCCVSNYYFSNSSPGARDYFHVTTFRGRPNQPVRDVLLMADNLVRGGIRKIFRRGVFKTRHIYKKKTTN
jgi:Rps23 Pro-64 3,4-dihydroxylase Tpa1-like proline 4-hydroxylase